MQLCKSLWIKASAKCINVNVNMSQCNVLNGGEMEGMFSFNSLVYTFMYSSEVSNSQKSTHIDFST